MSVGISESSVNNQCERRSGELHARRAACRNRTPACVSRRDSVSARAASSASTVLVRATVMPTTAGRVASIVLILVVLMATLLAKGGAGYAADAKRSSADDGSRPIHIVAPNPQAQGWSTLFEPRNRAQLREALDGVSVFKIMINCVTNLFGYCAEADWGVAAQALRELNVSIGIEAGMFSGLRSSTLPNSCNGTKDALDDLSKIQLLLDAGGRPEWWTMDSVFQHTYPYPPSWLGWQHQAASDCCNFTIAEAALQGAAYAAEIRARLPGIKIGLNEPVPWYSVKAINGSIFPSVPAHVGEPDYSTGRELIEVIMAFDAALRARGEPPVAYFHADQPLEYSIGELNHGGNGYYKLGALQAAIEQRGMEFGKYFNSQDGGQRSDQLFSDRTLLDVRSFAAYNEDRIPQHVIVESWFPLPSRLISESGSPLVAGPTFFDVATSVRDWIDKIDPTASSKVKERQWSHHTARLAAVQLNASHQDLPQEELLALLESYIERASSDAADLVVFPEYILGSIHPATSDPRVGRIAAAAAKAHVNVAIGCWALDMAVNASTGCPGVGCAEQYSNAVLIISRAGELIGKCASHHALTESTLDESIPTCSRYSLLRCIYIIIYATFMTARCTMHKSRHSDG